MRFKILVLGVICSVLVSCTDSGILVRENPLLVSEQGEYGLPNFESVRTSDFVEAFNLAFESENAQVDSLLSSELKPIFENVILPLDTSDVLLSRLETIFDYYTKSNADETLLNLYLELKPKIKAHKQNILLNAELFAKVKLVYINRSKLDKNKKRLTELTYAKMVDAGAELDKVGQNTLRDINEKLWVAEASYKVNSLKRSQDIALVYTRDQVDGLPIDIKNFAFRLAQELKLGKDMYAFYNSEQSLMPLVEYTTNEKARAAAFEKLFVADTLDINPVLLDEITSLRDQMAKVKGYENYADYALKGSFVGDSQGAKQLLDKIWSRAKQPSCDESKLINSKRDRISKRREVKNDWFMLSRKQNTKETKLDELKLRPFFSVASVRDGIFHLSNRLFGLTFRPVSAPTYNEDCLMYQVMDIDNTHLGVLCLDLFPRKGKQTSIWAQPILSSADNPEGGAVVGINLSLPFASPNNMVNAGMNLSEVEDFFNEFGRALYFMFTDVAYRGLSGRNYEIEEIAANIFGNWAFASQFLVTYALNGSDVVIQNYNMKSINLSKHFNQGFKTSRDLSTAYLDLAMHTDAEFRTDSLHYRQQLEQLGMIEDVIMLSSVSNFDEDYSARYYSMLFADVVGRDIFDNFVESKELFNRKLALRLRDKLFSKANSLQGVDLLREFVSEELNFEPYFDNKGL